MPPLPSRSAPAPVRLAYAVAASVLAGLLMAGAAFPIVGGLGLTAKAGADEFLVLPAEFDQVPLAQRSRILASDGSLLAILYRENRVFAPLQFIPEVTQKAFIAVEDARFYAHHGVDYKGTLRAAVENSQAGSVTQGGSTLTQQYVKNALLQAASTEAGQDAAREVTLERKLKEARYALAIERKLTKDEILERYLNIAYFGNGVYGVGTASTFYFGKPARDLTLGESALLAGIVQSPGRFDPVKATEDVAQMERLVARRNLVLGRMKAENFIDEAERTAAADAPPEFRFRPVLSGCENPAVKAPFFCDYVRRYLEDDTEVGAALGRTREERQDRLLAGGLTIKTTLDPVVQEAAQRAAEEAIPPADTFRGEDFGAATAVNVVQPGTGDVRAMAVNRRYTEQKTPGHTKVNLAIGGSSGFQGGSTFKAFVLADALRQGIPLSFTTYAPQKYTSEVFLNYTPDGVEPYTMQNAGDSEAGTF
ncbi:MAG: penicillin-binding protein, partial [Frankiales bacterium]